MYVHLMILKNSKLHGEYKSIRIDWAEIIDVNAIFFILQLAVDTYILFHIPVATIFFLSTDLNCLLRTELS